MKICIIGAGPAGIYLGKFLSKRNFCVHLYEKESKPYGLKRTSFSPELREKLDLTNTEGLKIFYNKEIIPEKINKLNYDIFVVATGGRERKLKIPGGNLAIPSSKIVSSYPKLKGDICIIGLGNVAMDIIRNIKGYRSLTAIGRHNILNSSFSNSEFAKIVQMGVKMYFSIWDKLLFFIKSFLPRRYRRRYELLNRINDGNVEIHFNTYPISIKNTGSRLQLHTNTFIREFDHIISAIGYEKQDFNDYNQVNKPLFFVGWSKLGRGTLTDVYFDAINTGNSILNFIKKSTYAPKDTG